MDKLIQNLEQICGLRPPYNLSDIITVAKTIILHCQFVRLDYNGRSCCFDHNTKSDWMSQSQSQKAKFLHLCTLFFSRGDPYCWQCEPLEEYSVKNVQ